MRQITGTHFFKSFSDGLFRAFRGTRTTSEALPAGYSRTDTHHSVPSLTGPRAWLDGFPWEKVLTTNQAQCQLQNTQTTPNPKCYDGVKAEWEKRFGQDMSLEKALDLCRQCEQKAPFVFSNTSTFSQIARGVVEDLVKHLPSVEAHIVRNTAAHYVTGTVSKKELFDILRFYETQWRPGLNKLSGNGVGNHSQSDA